MLGNHCHNIFCLYYSKSKDFVEIADILDTVTGSDSECDVLSSGNELDDDGDEYWEMNNVQGGCGGDYDDGSGIGCGEEGDDDGIVVVMLLMTTMMTTVMMIMYPCCIGYKFERQRPFVPHLVSPLMPEPERPAPDEKTC